jgi:hypothetical protein
MGMTSIGKNSTLSTRLKNRSSDDIEQRIGSLIGHYLCSRSPAIALSVVRHIELLCAHPGFEGDTAQRCVYLRMRAHWRWLARTASVGESGVKNRV